MKNKLSKNASILLYIGMTFLAALMIASTFVNVYLIRLTNNMGIMILQNVVTYAALLAAFVLGSKYAKKGNMMTLLRAGLICNMLYYLAILLLKEKAGTYLIYLGLFNGIGQGFYYFTFNILVGAFTKEDELSTFFSYQSSFSYVFGVIAPMVSGFIIVQFTELTGYYVLFAASLVLFILAILLSTKLGRVSSDTDYHILETLKLKNNKYWDINKYLNFSFGLREAIYAQIFTVFAYLVISNEQVIGNLSSLMSLLGTISSLLIASKFTIQNQKNYHMIFAVIYIISLSTLGIIAKPWTLYFTYILNGVVLVWNTVIFSNLKYQLSSRAKTELLNDADFIIVTEFPMAAGRLIGLLIFFALNYLFGGFNLYRYLLVAISLIALLDHYMIKTKINWLQ